MLSVSQKMNSVIVSGATSMLGLALINECISNDTQVIAIIRENSLKRRLLPRSDLIIPVECDLSNLVDLHIDTRLGYDVFYHFAWEATTNADRNNVDKQYQNIGYTLNAVRLAQTIGCKRFIGAGSQAEYGRVSGVISPDIHVSPDNAYGIAKYAAGRFAAIQCERLGMEFIWTRIFSIYGVNDIPSTMIMYCIDSLLKGKIPELTKCEQIWDYLNCEDAAKAFYLIGKKGNDRAIYHIGSGYARPLVEYVKIVRDAIDPSLPLGIGVKDYALKQVMCLCPDIASLTADTGFKPAIPFEQGIKKTIDWYKGSHSL